MFQGVVQCFGRNSQACSKLLGFKRYRTNCVCWRIPYVSSHASSVYMFLLISTEASSAASLFQHSLRKKMTMTLAFAFVGRYQLFQQCIFRFFLDENFDLSQSEQNNLLA